jgi:hypothetical protein
MAVVVDAIESQIEWWIPHISKKIFKRMPPLTDSDAAASVIPIAFVVRVTAALQHARPAAVSTSVIAGIRMTVC